MFFGGVDGFKTVIQTREVPQKIEPNQGILRSRQNALSMGFFFSAIYGVLNIFILGTIFALFSSLYWQVFLPLQDGAWLGLAGGLRLGLLVGVIFGFLEGFFEYGGTTLFQHYSLRYELMKSKTLSLPFFDKSLINLFKETEKFIFMRQVGGGWVFIHRALLDFFATQR